MAGCRVDVHVKVLDESSITRAKRRSVDVLVYAPHFTPWPAIVEQAKRSSDDELVVVPGREVFTGPWYDRKHVLALDLKRPVPDFLDLETTMQELTAQDACLIAPHPAYLTISLVQADIERYRDALDAIEVYNPKFLPWHRRRARQIAKAVQRPTVVSSYAHLPSSVGAATIELSTAVSDTSDLIEAIRSDRIDGHRFLGSWERHRISAGELIHLGWENTAQKLYRAATRGTVPTHPSSSIYRDWSDDDVA